MILPTSVELYNLSDDPYEKNNVAAAHPEKVAAMQQRLEAAGRESAKPLALRYIFQAGMKTTVPLLPTDEAFYTDADDDSAPQRLVPHTDTRFATVASSLARNFGPLRKNSAQVPHTEKPRGGAVWRNTGAIRAGGSFLDTNRNLLP